MAPDAPTGGPGAIAPELAGALDILADGTTRSVLRFVEELRTVGVPVSIAEGIDALAALEHVPLAERGVFKAVLSSTLIKNPAHQQAFETVFEIFFAMVPSETVDGGSDDRLPDELIVDGDADGAQAGSGGGDVDAEALVEALLQAMLSRDDAAMQTIARQAVSAFAGMEPGRPVGGTYYLYRTLRGVDLESLLDRMLQAERAKAGLDADADANDPIAERLVRDDVQARIDAFKDRIKDEIRRRLVEDRGAAALAKSLRKPLLEHVDFMHATSVEMAELKAAIAPLARRLAVRLALRRQSKRGRLDIRKTMRESLASGGVPLDPKFKRPRPHKPEIMLLCDISGSVASFARFTMQLVFTMSQQFSKVRSFVFIDDIDEVTQYFDTDDLTQALIDVNTNAKVVWIDGHSDYGHSFARFAEVYGNEVTPKTTLLITGDARNNYHASEAAALRDMADKARHSYWLNPEPMAYWDTGDSIISEYAAVCDAAYEVRNLAQLERFIEALVDPTA